MWYFAYLGTYYGYVICGLETILVHWKSKDIYRYSDDNESEGHESGKASNLILTKYGEGNLIFEWLIIQKVSKYTSMEVIL